MAFGTRRLLIGTALVAICSTAGSTATADQVLFEKTYATSTTILDLPADLFDVPAPAMPAQELAPVDSLVCAKEAPRSQMKYCGRGYELARIRAEPVPYHVRS
jgi:hypothetical protein